MQGHFLCAPVVGGVDVCFGVSMVLLRVCGVKYLQLHSKHNISILTRRLESELCCKTKIKLEEAFFWRD